MSDRREPLLVAQYICVHPCRVCYCAGEVCFHLTQMRIKLICKIRLSLMGAESVAICVFIQNTLHLGNFNSILKDLTGEYVWICNGVFKSVLK